MIAGHKIASGKQHILLLQGFQNRDNSNKNEFVVLL